MYFSIAILLLKISVLICVLQHEMVLIFYPILYINRLMCYYQVEVGTVITEYQSTHRVPHTVGVVTSPCKICKVPSISLQMHAVNW